MNKGLIQVDGKFYKKCKVVILPTEKADLILFTDTNILKYSKGEQRHKYAENCPQHLYILSDDEIKEGDWVYCSWSLPERRIFQVKAIKSDHYVDSKSYYHPKTGGNFISKEIIASTDPELGHYLVQNERGSIFQQSPRPSDAFLEKYCELGGIDEVLVEYEMWAHTEEDPQYKLKVAPDNTITIKSVKTNQDKKKARELLQKFYPSFEIFKKSHTGNTDELIDRWVEENF